MGFFDQLFRRKNNSAQIARDRLIIALQLQRDSNNREQHAFMESMKKEIVAVVEKYFEIDFEDIELNINKEGDTEVLALNINLPEGPRKNAQAQPNASCRASVTAPTPQARPQQNPKLAANTANTHKTQG